MKTTFTIFGKPQGKQRPRVTKVGNFARAYTPEQTVSYENLVKLSYKQTSNDFYIGAIKIRIYAYYSLPKSFSKTKMNIALNGGIYPLVKPDLDNIVKVICDALNGIAYKDDTQIVSILAFKYYAEAPSVVVEIEEELTEYLKL